MFQNLNIFSSLTKNFLSNTFAKDIFARFKSKKSSSCTRNKGGRPHPKHRGPKVRINKWVPAGSSLFMQRTLRVHPGLNVGMGRNGTLFALKSGTVMSSCEQFDPNWEKNRVIQAYGKRKGLTIFKKYYHIVTEPQHNRFNLIHLI